ncbi:hypothetical protein Scep_024980 [Stephania cephalantha]|uniref:Uncharacterized protein n=1 Tax=Stephania cephalantha TaxID=152367 RepID=A0AAP0HYY1_9MAGN
MMFHTRRGSGAFRPNCGRKPRRRITSVRLGGNKHRSTTHKGWAELAGASMKVMYKRYVNIRWLKLQYWIMLKRLKEYYYSVIRDLIDAGATMSTIMNTITTENYRGVPMVGAGAGAAAALAVPSRYESRTGVNRVIPLAVKV